MRFNNEKLNIDLIYKMGWSKFHPTNGFGIGGIIFQDDREVKHYIDFPLIPEQQSTLFVIKEDKKLIFKFIKVTYPNNGRITEGYLQKVKFQSYPFQSNLDLFKLIKLNLACNQKYQRFFQINHILK